MSSPAAVKVTRPVPPWPKDYHTSVAELESNDLLRSTLTDEGRAEKEHLGFTETSKQVTKSKPYPEHVERSS